VFLPVRIAVFAAACLFAAACGGHGTPPAPPPAPATLAHVVAGGGEVAAADLARVQATVTAELPLLAPVFPGAPKHPFFVHVHADRAALPAALAPHLHPDAPAFALLGAHQIHLVLDEVGRLGLPLRSVVRHELTHELLDQHVAPHGRRIPRWFHEGLAQVLAGETYLRAREDELTFALLAQRLRNFAELDRDFPAETTARREAYAQSFSYVAWLAARHGLDELVAVAAAADDITPFPSALAGRLRRPTYWLEEHWRAYVLHGSGAPWRIVFDQWFSLLLVALLPVLVLGLRRHLAREAATRRRLAAIEASPPPPPWPPALPSPPPWPPAAVALAAAPAPAPAPPPLDGANVRPPLVQPEP
jgi:hypothetical protein